MTYTLAFDLGSNSVGVAAVAHDPDGNPTEILHAESVIHEGGVYDKIKGSSRKATLGSARRSRNRRRHRESGSRNLDKVLARHGLPTSNEVVSGRTQDDPSQPYGGPTLLRGHMCHTRLPDKELPSALSRIAHHMYSRRGFRNSWKSVDFEKRSARGGYSERYGRFKARAEKVLGTSIPEDSAPSEIAELIHASREGHDQIPLHGKSAEVLVLNQCSCSDAKKKIPKCETIEGHCEKVLSKAEAAAAANPTIKNTQRLSKIARLVRNTLAAEQGVDIEAIRNESLCRADYIREWYKICDTQGVDADIREDVATVIINQKHPGAAAEKLAKDCPVLPKHQVARKNSIAFQEFRIATMIGNLRHRGKPLDVETRKKVFDVLNEWSSKTAPTWAGVIAATELGSLNGYDNLGRPEFNRTHFVMSNVDKAKSPIRSFWKTASREDRDAFLAIIDNTASNGTNAEATARVQNWIDTLSDEDMDVLSGIDLKDEGRAAYSLPVLQAIADKCRTEVIDEHYAFIELYGREPHIRVKGRNLGDPVGNPTVDVNLKIVEKLHDRMVSKFGKPSRIVVETARDVTLSHSSRQTIHNVNTSRRKKRDALIESYNENAVSKLAGTRDNKRRVGIYKRQSGTCLYCGAPMASANEGDMEADHIIPVARGGASISLNLAGCCRGCNNAKGARSLPEWLGLNSPKHKKVLARANKLEGVETKFKEQYRERMFLTEETYRPTESLGWVSKELRSRLEHRYRKDGVRVLAPNGYATATARHLGKFNNLPGMVRLPETPEKSKCRIDRRHHAIDSLVMTTLTPEVLAVIQERDRLREASKTLNGADVTWAEDGGIEVTDTWKNYRGKNREEQSAFDSWFEGIKHLRDLTVQALADNSIPVTKHEKGVVDNIRVHKDTFFPFEYKQPTEAFTAKELARIENKGIWRALIESSQLDRKGGIPEDPNRVLRNCKPVPALGIEMFPGDVPGVKISDGSWADMGPGSIHQMRVYQPRAGKPVIVPTLSRDLIKAAKRSSALRDVPLPADCDSFRHKGLAHRDMPAKPEMVIERGMLLSVSSGDLWATDENGKHLLSGAPFEKTRILERQLGIRIPIHKYVITSLRWDERMAVSHFLIGELPKEYIHPAGLLRASSLLNSSVTLESIYYK